MSFLSQPDSGLSTQSTYHHQQVGNANTLDVSRAQQPSYSEQAIDLIEHSPYPNVDIAYELQILPDSTVLDFRDSRDLKKGRGW